MVDNIDPAFFASDHEKKLLAEYQKLGHEAKRRFWTAIVPRQKLDLRSFFYTIRNLPGVSSVLAGIVRENAKSGTSPDAECWLSKEQAAALLDVTPYYIKHNDYGLITDPYAKDRSGRPMYRLDSCIKAFEERRQKDMMRKLVKKRKSKDYVSLRKQKSIRAKTNSTQ